jgi:hypothetical protein
MKVYVLSLPYSRSRRPPHDSEDPSGRSEGVGSGQPGMRVRGENRVPARNATAKFGIQPTDP